MKTKKIKNDKWLAWQSELPLYNMGSACGKTEFEAINNLQELLNRKKEIHEKNKK